jgi:hypothetical protein
MRHLETRLARLEGRTMHTVWEGQRPADDALTTPERTALVAQILIDAGALRITPDGALLTRTSGAGWTPYTP